MTTEETGLFICIPRLQDTHEFGANGATFIRIHKQIPKVTIQVGDSDEFAYPLQGDEHPLGLLVQPYEIHVFLVVDRRAVVYVDSLNRPLPLSLGIDALEGVSIYPRTTYAEALQTFRNFHLQTRLCIVAGAGPVGLASALLLKKQGWHPTIIEKFKKHELCNRKQILYVEEEALEILRRVNVTIDDQGNKFALVSIKDLQSKLLLEAENKAIPILYGQQVTGYKDKSAGLYIESSRVSEDGTRKIFNYRCSMLIGADGGSSSVKNFALSSGTPGSMFFPSYLDTGLWAIVAFVSVKSKVEIFKDNALAIDDGHWLVRAYPTNKAGTHCYMALEPANAETFAKYRSIGDWVENLRNSPGNAKMTENIIDQVTDVVVAVAKRMGAEVVKNNNDISVFSASVSLAHTSTVKLPLSGAVIMIQGDAAHKANFITGSGVNTGLKELAHLERYLSECQVNLDEAVRSKVTSDRGTALSLFNLGLQYAPYLAVQSKNGMTVTMKDSQVSIQLLGSREDVRIDIPIPERIYGKRSAVTSGTAQALTDSTDEAPESASKGDREVQVKVSWGAEAWH